MKSLPAVINDPQVMKAWVRARRAAGETVGFVPTMGYLHEGHLALVRTARERTSNVVVSIFVNPLQFGPTEDFDRYPRDLFRDLELLGTQSVPVVFHPSREGFYPVGFQTTVTVSEVTRPLCGASRPGHFNGVTTVVNKLFNIVEPDFAVFGAKDYQQLATIRRMVADLSMAVEIVENPIVREPDGLAMSSRNVYLSPSERAAAPVLRQSLLEALAVQESGVACTPRSIEAMVRASIAAVPEARIDYVSCLDADYLSEIDDFSARTVLAVAVFFGKTRLIDNIILPARKKSGRTVSESN